MIYKNLYYIYLIIFLQFFACNRENEIANNELLNNQHPKYEESNYISLEKIFSIPLISNSYEISRATFMCADKFDNLFVLSDTEATITEFNKNGKYIRTLGGFGQGPRELQHPQYFFIYENDFHILNGTGNLKIWDENGAYIDQVQFPTTQNMLVHKTKNKYFVLSSRVISLELFEYTLYTTNLRGENKNIIMKYDLNRKKFFHFLPRFALIFDNDDNYYFPGSQDAYVINKMNKDGDVLMSFGREYNSTDWSVYARESYKRRYSAFIEGGTLWDIPKSPPIIRKLFSDSSDNIWVLTGEANIDSDKKPFNVNVDIFNNNGKWLTSIEKDDFTLESIINNNRLYSHTKLTNPEIQQFVNVYRIVYHE